MLETDYLLENISSTGKHLQRQGGNQYIDNLCCNFSLDEWRKSLKRRSERDRFAEVHKYLESHLLWSLSLHISNIPGNYLN